jgi:alkylation response protein AidB-like acyl-CoA dehydrogenase
MNDRPLEPATTYLERAKSLVPRIAASAEAIERARRLPEPLVAALVEAGLFRMLVPRALQGGEIDPPTFVEVIETIAKADASVAWCLCQASVSMMVSAFIPTDAAWEIFGCDPGAILAWGPPQGARAVAVDGGYRLTGTWSFASGVRHATWLGGQTFIYGADGAPRQDANGAPVERTLLFPAKEATLTDVWHVIGLKGTATDAFAVKDLFVPEARAVARDEQKDRRHQGPLYCLRTNNLFSCGFAAVGLGIARSLLDSVMALAMEKTPRGYRSKLRESAVTQSDMALAEARLRAARHYLFGTVSDIWQAVQRSNELTLDQRVTIRLAATHVLQEAIAVGDFAYHSAGATAVFESHPFERRFRDLHAVSQQIQARRAHYETVGRHLFGFETDTMFL